MDTIVTNTATVVLGLILGFYWARVIKLVIKTRKKFGESAQLVPTEPLGRVLRVIWYPTVGLWCLHPWATLAFGGGAVEPASGEGGGAIGGGAIVGGAGGGISGGVSGWAGWAVTPLVSAGWWWVSVVGVVTAIAALYATMVCWRKMGKSWRMGINPGEKTELVVSGPYGYVAHPIYALQQVLALASVVVIPAPAMIAVAVIELLFLQWEARREEKNLIAVHGETYGRYLRGVGRFLPKSAKPFVP